VAGIIFSLLIMFILGIPVNAFYIFIAGAAAVIPDLIDYAFLAKHKRETHNIWILIGLIALGFVNQIFIIVAAAYLSHLILDLMTYHGVRLFYPLKPTNYVVMSEKNRIKTGTNREKALFFFLCIIMVGGVLLSYQVFSLIDSTAASSGTTEAVGNNSTNGTAKTYINVAVDIDQNMLNKNVSITNGQNETNIIVTEVNPGG
jgi:inner membrane protein